jgi:deoxyribose-phosphate aldolase
MNIANYIDHTFLKFDTSSEDVRRVCEEALQHGFSHVCIPPYFVKEAFRKLENSKVGVCTVAGFPYGYQATPVKVDELKRAMDEGGDELDVVINIAAVKSNDWSYIANDIESCTRAVHLKGKCIKIILETGAFDDLVIEKLCQICIESGVNFVKTSTGVNAMGATEEKVKLLKNLVGNKAQVKASGGIRTLADAMLMLEAGATRIGTSAGVAMVLNGQ